MTTTTTRRPSAATMRAALKRAGVSAADVKALNPKSLIEQFTSLQEQVETSTPAPKAKRTSTRTSKAPAKAPKPTSAPLPPANCACGCGEPCITSKARFRSGHDARFAGAYGRGEITLNEHQKAVLDASPALRAKVDRVIATHATRLAAKQAREVAKQAAKVAYEQAMADLTGTPSA